MGDGAKGLVDDPLAGDGPFTVFALANQALAKLDKRRPDYRLAPCHAEELNRVLTHHVMAAE